MSFVTVCLADEQVNCHFVYDVAECRFLSRVEGNLCLEMSSARFQKLFWLCSWWEIFAWAYYKIAMVLTRRKFQLGLAGRDPQLESVTEPGRCCPKICVGDVPFTPSNPHPPEVRAKYAIFPTLIQTWPNIRYPFSDLPKNCFHLSREEKIKRSFQTRPLKPNPISDQNGQNWLYPISE